MNSILCRLAVGAFDDLPVLPDTITAVLSLCERQPNPLPHCLMIHAPIPDEVFLLASTWSELTACLARLLAQGHNVFVHCRLGKSRSPSLCAAYLMRCGYAPDVAFKIVKYSHADAEPHPETFKSVLAWWGQIETLRCVGPQQHAQLGSTLDAPCHSSSSA